MTYKEYLKTSHWLNKRKEVLEFWGNSCSVCNSTENLHVHHRFYNLFKEKISDCIVLCQNCHDCHHNRELIDFDFHPDLIKGIIISERMSLEEMEKIIEDAITLKENGFESKFHDYRFNETISKIWKHEKEEEGVIELKNYLIDIKKNIQIKEIDIKIHEINQAISKENKEELVVDLMKEISSLMSTKNELIKSEREERKTSLKE